MPSPYDYTKLKKYMDKSISGMSYGFNDPSTWMNTGCYVLNYLISNRFDGGIPLEGKFTMFAGDSGCLPASAKVAIKKKLIYADNIGESVLERYGFGSPTKISVGELRGLVLEGHHKILIQTPDGFQPVTAWFDKGLLPMVEVKTASGLTTRCASNHLIERLAGPDQWVPAGSLVCGEVVLTYAADHDIGDPVVSVSSLPDEECFDFTVDHPNHRYWGDGFSSHNSGKSYVAVANIIKWCQQNNVWPVLIDTENALDMSWLAKLDVQTGDEHLHKFSAATVDDVAKFLGHVVDEYKTATENMVYKDRPKMLMIIDSLGMLITANQEKQFMEGDQKGDMGIKAKQITALIRVLMTKISTQPIGLIATNHVFDAQDQYKPDSIPGGKMLEFASSVIVQMNKYLLKEDDEGNKLVDGGVAGIRSTAVVRKSRYAKPFERLKINIPYETGMDPYSGLFDLFEKKGVIVKDKARYSYTSPETGEIFLDWRKNFKKAGILDTIMAEWKYWEGPDAKVGFDQTGATDDEDA